VPHGSITHANHPRGNDGARVSIWTIAGAVARGRVNPDVIAWSRKVIADAGRPSEPAAQVAALLDAVRASHFYIADPIDTQLLVAPECFLGACDGRVIQGAACGTLTLALASALASIGINVVVVGQAFAEDKHITHVLVAAEVAPGDWRYAEPSRDVPVGARANEPTREVWVNVPDGTLVCDHAPDCISTMQGIPAVMDREHGDFVGIGVGDPATPPPASSANAMTWWQYGLLLALGFVGIYGLYRVERMVDHGK